MSRLSNILRYATLTILCGVVFSPHSSAHIYTTSMLDSIVEVEQVVVKTGRIGREIIPVQVLEGEELGRLNSHSVADAIRYFSGALIKDYGGIGGLKTVDIRSLGSQHVGVFYDGIESGNAQNGVVDLGRFSLDNMEAVTIYNGQKSSIFQPAKDFASASAIYLTTRRPRFEEGKDLNIKLSLNGGSFGTINPSALYERKINERLSASISAEYLYTTGRYRFTYAKADGYDTTETRENGDVESFRIEGSLFGRGERSEWRAKLYMYSSERGYPGASVRGVPGLYINQDRQWDENIFAQGSYRKQFGEWYSLLVSGKVAYDYLHYISDPSLDTSTMAVDNEYFQKEGYLSVAHLFRITRWWSASLATDGQYNTLDADMLDFAYPRRTQGFSSLATSIDLNRFKFQASLMQTNVWDTTRDDDSAAEASNRLTPSLVASYRLASDYDITLRALFKKTFRMPTLNDLYYVDVGSRDLSPEIATQYNIGVTSAFEFSTQSLRSIELSADCYYNEVSDKIIATPTSNQFRWTMTNLGEVEIRGIDVALSSGWRVAREVALVSRISYTYQRAEDVTTPSEQWYRGQIPYVPWHSGSVVGNVDWREWSFNYSFIYTGERYTSRANIIENYMQPWYTHDAGVSRTIPLPRRNATLKVSAEVNNLLNQQYEVVNCYPMPGTNFKIKLNLTM